MMQSPPPPVLLLLPVLDTYLPKTFYALLGSILIYHALGDLATVPLALRESKFESDVLGQWGDMLTEDKLQSLARTTHKEAGNRGRSDDDG